MEGMFPREKPVLWVGTASRARSGLGRSPAACPLPPSPLCLLSCYSQGAPFDFFCFLSLPKGAAPLEPLGVGCAPWGVLGRSRGAPGRALGPPSIWTRGKWLSPTTCPSGPTKASLQSGLRSTHAAGPWLLFSTPARAPPQGHLRSIACLPLLPSLGAGPAEGCVSVIQGPPLLRQTHSPRMSPREYTARGKFVISPEPPVTSLQREARWGPAAAYLGMRRGLCAWQGAAQNREHGSRCREREWQRNRGWG